MMQEVLFDNPTVSVVLPVYNGEKFVLDAIKSIQGQTFTDWELVILDDGSTDDSLATCQACAAKDQRIRVFSNGINLGLSKTMNKLVQLAQGKYIAIQEQDDFSMPVRLAQEVTMLESNSDVGLVSGIAAWLDDGGQIFHYFGGKSYPENKNDMVTFIYFGGGVSNAACMFRRTVMDKIVGPFDEDAKIPDYQFFLNVAHHFRMVGIPEVLVHMRRGQKHDHLTAQKKIFFSESRRCRYVIYNKYKNDIHSPINYRLYRKVMADLLIWEGRFFGRGTGLFKLIQAICYEPLNKTAWKSLGELIMRGLKKFKAVFISPFHKGKT
jgi:glycosyltransferase involved in cell wall biosynthesis